MMTFIYFAFLVCIEFLSTYINNNPNIKDIKINNIGIKQTLFADDCTFLNEGSKESFWKKIHINIWQFFWPKPQHV